MYIYYKREGECMYTEYSREENISDKTEKEKSNELIVNIIKTKMELNANIKNYEYAEGDLIDYYLYQIKANKSKLDYLIKQAKEKNLAFDENIKFEA
jgi:hypothetical protein